MANVKRPSRPASIDAHRASLIAIILLFAVLQYSISGENHDRSLAAPFSAVGSIWMISALGLQYEHCCLARHSRLLGIDAETECSCCSIWI